MKIKKHLRHIAFVLAICLACLAPAPIIFRKKEHRNQTHIEQLDQDEDENENELKALF